LGCYESNNHGVKGKTGALAQVLPGGPEPSQTDEDIMRIPEPLFYLHYQLQDQQVFLEGLILDLKYGDQLESLNHINIFH